MQKAQYLHCSCFGSFRIDCDILKSSDKEYKISYTEPFFDEVKERWVNKEDVDLPKFADLVI